jgi:hypothetical protein
MSATRLTLGTRVRYSSLLLRRAEHVNGSTRKTWEPMSLGFDREGIVVGLRTLSNGIHHWGFSDEGGHYEQKSSLQAVLIAWDVRKTHDRVLLADVEVIEP